MFDFLRPTFRVESVLDLSLERLAELGLDALLLDVDSTLKAYRDERLSAEMAAWIEQLRAARIGLCLVSNGRGPRIARVAESLDLPYVAKALKPLPFGLRRAMRRMGFSRERTAMVGDQLFADIMAGRVAGLTSILVEPIHPEQEHWYTRMKRPLERFLLRGVEVASLPRDVRRRDAAG